ncbi:MAG: hypothetical protein JSW61_14525 [Candidatus Thorarchaeota archaeon]|nr:MAG: hypothetical protein JSW61_14525 [Candidatus Thorarchaeota archaeon]
MSSGMRVFFDQTQNERGRLDSTYSELAQLLKDNDIEAMPYSEYMILAKKIAECKVLVFGCPNSSKLRQPEVDTLKRFVENGGGLFLLSLSGGDRGLMNNMSKISEGFGISFENTAIKDERNNAGLPTMPIISDITAHPITDDVRELLIPSGCTLKVTEKATVIACTSDTADPPKQPVIAVAEHGKGRILCVGSYEIFRRGGGLQHPGNKTFAVNAFRWLGDQVVTPKPSKVAEEQKKKEETPMPSVSKEFESTLRRLVDAVFDLQKDIEKVSKHVSSVEDNIEKLRDQFQDFAEKTQGQLGVMIPAKQFQSDEESKEGELKDDVKALKKELKSVGQLREHIEQRHSSGAMPTESYQEQADKLDKRLESLKKKLEKKEKELEDLKASE